MALKQYIATDIRNVHNFCDGNIFKEWNIIGLPLLHVKGNTNQQAFTACTRKTITFTAAAGHVQQVLHTSRKTCNF